MITPENFIKYVFFICLIVCLALGPVIWTAKQNATEYKNKIVDYEEIFNDENLDPASKIYQLKVAQCLAEYAEPTKIDVAECVDKFEP